MSLLMSAASVEMPIGCAEVFFAVIAFVVFVSENERLPGRYVRWSPYTKGASEYYAKGSVTVGVRRKSNHVPLTTIDPSADDFDDLLAAAESLARERCISLNATDRGMRRKLP